MSLSSEQERKLHNKYLELLRFYQGSVKSIVLAAERVDREQRLSGSSIIEIRSAFEHISRAHAALYGFGDDEVKDSGLSHHDYCGMNLNKAHGHLYRAAYDAYDAIGIAITEIVRDNLDSISKVTLYSVIPEATEIIIVPYEIANQLITEEKKKKDVVSKEIEEKIFLEYEKAILGLIEVKKFLEVRMSALIAFDTELQEKEKIKKEENSKREELERKKDRRNRLLTVVGIVIAALTLLATVLVGLPKKAPIVDPSPQKESTKVQTLDNNTR